MTNDELIALLWSMSLSENLGDVADALSPILKKFNLPTLSLEELHEELVRRDLRPQWSRE